MPDLYRRILLVTHEFYPRRGGIATYAEEIARAAAELGHELEVWAQDAGVAEEKPWPFPLRRLPLKGTHDLACQFRLAREFVRERRRVRRSTLYLVEPGPMLSMMWLQFFHFLRPGRLVLTFHGSEILRFSRFPVRRQLASRLIGRADRVSTLTHYTNQLLCSLFPQAIDKALLAPGALRTDLPRRELAPAKSEPGRQVVLTVARLHPRKGQLHIIDALHALPPALRDSLEYWIVGGGTKSRYRRQLQQAAERSGLRVRFWGDVDDAQLSELYDQADLFALTSVPYSTSVEGFGLVYLEASAHGLPIVAHATGGVAEAVLDGVTGLLVPPHDRAARTAAFRRLLEDSGLRRRLGEQGRSWAQQSCWKRSALALFAPDERSASEEGRLGGKAAALIAV